jgi:hypothetical protein
MSATPWPPPGRPAASRQRVNTVIKQRASAAGRRGKRSGFDWDRGYLKAIRKTSGHLGRWAAYTLGHEPRMIRACERLRERVFFSEFTKAWRGGKGSLDGGGKPHVLADREVVLPPSR